MSGNKSISVLSRTNIMAYGFIPGESGHGPDAEQVKKLKALYKRATKASLATPSSGRAGSARASVENDRSARSQ